MTLNEKKSWAVTVIRRLSKKYPEAKVALNYANPLQLLIATILSAQSTDKQINLITAKLFLKYPHLEDYAEADPQEFEVDIRSSGFYRNKAKNIIASTRLIRDRFGGEVPRTMEDLISLPGVARKTANIVLFHAFGIVEGIAVDTHVKRLAGLLGLSNETNPDRIEKDLMKLIPRREWGKVNMLLVTHGRQICVARRPKCGQCVLADRCPSVKQPENKNKE